MASSASSLKVVLDYEAVRRATHNFAPSQQIGNGGFGPVYQGTLFHTPVAVKVLSKDSSQGVAQFESEVRLLTALRHPNLVTLLGGAVGPGGQRCLVYELMKGGSADDYLPFARGGEGDLGAVKRRGVMGWRERVKVLLGAARGLRFLHEAKPPVVHLDFKGSNILLDKAFNPKVGDFGLARQAALTHPSKTHASTRHMAGTYGYICPDYASTGHYDARCDVYSFGVVCLQMLTGLPAITEEGATLAAAVKRDFQNDDAAFSRADPEAAWPRAAYVTLVALASACVRGHRAKRPSMGEVLDELEKFGNGTFDRLSKKAEELGRGASIVEQRRSHLMAVDANGRSEIGGKESGERSNVEPPRFDTKRFSDDYNSLENSARGSELGVKGAPYSANYVARPSEYERDVVGPSALWAPARPSAPKKCARRKDEQIADELEGVVERREAPEVSWWPRSGGQTLTLADTPRKEAVHAGMPAAGGPSGGPMRGGLSQFAVFPPSHLRGASPAVRLASSSSSSGSQGSKVVLVRR